MKNELAILKEVSELLSAAKIPFMLTGSMAMNYYATPRMTRDLDIIIELNSPDVDKIVSAFKKDFYIDKDMVNEAINFETMFNIIHNETIIKVDFIIRKNQEYRKFEFMRKQKVKIHDFETYIVSLEDLILSKFFWAKDSQSEVQMRDINNLMEKNPDHNYLNKWAKKLGLDDFPQANNE